MILSKERIQEIKEIALTNLKRADNSREGLDKEKFWSLYRADVRELLNIINSLEEKEKDGRYN
jgi:cytidylate kinase